MFVCNKLRIVKGNKTPHLENDVIVKCPNLHLNRRIELGNIDFRNQRTQVSQNRYVAKNQTKMSVGVTFWFPVYPTSKRKSSLKC